MRNDYCFRAQLENSISLIALLSMCLLFSKQVIPLSTVKTRPETFLFQVLENTLGSLAIRPEAVPGGGAGHQDWVGAALDEGQN